MTGGSPSAASSSGVWITASSSASESGRSCWNGCVPSGSTRGATWPTISKVVEHPGGDPAGEAEYPFECESPRKFLGTATVLEHARVAAYADAAPTVSADAVFAAGKSHNVQTRRAGYRNELKRSSSSPAAADQAGSTEAVLAAAGQLIEEGADG